MTVDRAAIQRISDGVPATTLFSDILTCLLDNGPQELPALIEAVQAGFLGTKQARLRITYAALDPWAEFLADGLSVLADGGFIQLDGDGWSLGPKFEPGRSLTIVRARHGKKAIKTQVDRREERETLDAADSTRLGISELAAQLREGRPGLRPLDERHVTELVQSMKAFGYLAEFPVLRDQYGRLLDGRHRSEAAKRVGLVPVTREIKTESDQHAVGLAWASGVNLPWSAKDRKAITSVLGGRAPHEVLGTRMSVRVVLQSNPRLSDREVARLTGLTHPTVKAHRDALELHGEVQRWDAEAEVLAAREQDPAASTREISQRTGVPQKTVSRLLSTESNGKTYHLTQSQAGASQSEPCPPARKPMAGPLDPRGSTTTAPAQSHWSIKAADRNNVEFLTRLLVQVVTDVAVLDELADQLKEAAEAMQSLQSRA